MHVLAIDQGTSATKALVIGPDTEVLGSAELPVATAVTPDGGVEGDPEELWRSVIEAGRAAVAAAGVQIDVVGLANQGETVLAWDRATGVPRTPAISWQDRRAAGVCERLADHADRLREVTGLPLDPYFVAPKLLWMREHLTRDGVATTTDAWLVHRLCGAYVTDAATASRSLLLDLDQVAWSAEAADVFGIDLDDLPEVVPCAGIVGETEAFGGRVPLAGLAVDQQAALFAEACFTAGDAKCTYGTGAFLLATVGEKPVRSTSGLAACVAWLLGDTATYCLDGQVYTVGAAVRWLAATGLIAGPEEIDGLVDAAADDESRTAFVPGLAGLGAPFWRPHARGAFTGIGLATGRAELVRAVIQGIAAQVAWLARAVGADLRAPLARLRADGGLTRSRTLMQAQADLLQAPVDVYTSPDATALGVAAFARLGVAAATTPPGPAQLAEAVGAWSPAATFEPRVSAAEADARLEAWRRAAEATMGL